jgi:ubiquinone/menaquinone biosynthesis C-methylase UbiE
MIERKSHWESVYESKSDQEVSWFREHLDNSLNMILKTGVEKDAAIIDVGGGSSTLADDLLIEGFIDVTVLDISRAALDRSRERLGSKADQIESVEADITKSDLPEDRYDVWHDRAVFHFLTDEEDRRRYIDLVLRSLKPGAHIIVASFSPNGPQKCSGLDVVRYSPSAISETFGGNFTMLDSMTETHETPFGTSQEFVYCYCRKLAE